MGKYEIHRSDGNADELYDAARKLGMSVAILNRPVDALVGCHGLTVAVEVKSAKGKLRPDQETFLATFRGAVAVWRTLDDVQETHDGLRIKAIRLAVP